MGYTIKIKKNARKDLSKLKAVHLNKKFDELIKIIKENPYQSPPSYEKLVGLNYLSRRLNIQHRLIYTVDDSSNQVIILSVWSHYERRMI
ncbi:Txe/YoeB family addiction module toxin [Enterococcus faecalis]|uniref:Txe/YoeB family addiction module toxin n=1 Tax=Enterococcus faecalis TaxID=1351 RepID=UPI002FBE1EFC